MRVCVCVCVCEREREREREREKAGMVRYPKEKNEKLFPSMSFHLLSCVQQFVNMLRQNVTNDTFGDVIT